MRHPSSHTTVRTVPYTAVQAEQWSLRCRSRRLGSPSCVSQRVGTAACMWDAPAFHHGPRPLEAEAQARSGSRPRFMSSLARVRGRFHCRHTRQRSLCRSHLSRSSKLTRTSARRKLKIVASQSQNALVLDALSQTGHQHVVVHTIEELLEIQVHHPAASCRDVCLRTLHGLMGAASRSKAEALLRKRLVEVGHPVELGNTH